MILITKSYQDDLGPLIYIDGKNMQSDEIAVIATRRLEKFLEGKKNGRNE